MDICQMIQTFKQDKKKHCEVMLVQFGLQSKPLDDLVS